MAVGLLIAFVVTTCAPTAQIIKDEENLKRRVEEYWTHKVKGEWDRAYSYEDTEFREKVESSKYAGQLMRSFTKWEKFSVVEVWTDGKEGRVKLNTKYRYLIPEFRKGSFERVVEEKWIKRDGLWYHLP